MRLIYTPDGGEKREFSFVPLKLMSPEAEAIETVGGPAWDSFDEFGVKFMKGNRRAYRAALWVMLKREQPNLRFADLVLRADEVQVDFDDDERARLREEIAADRDLDPEQREHLVRLMDDTGAVDVPKDPTGSGSPPSATPSDTGAASTGSP